MFDIGSWEVLIIAIVVLLVVGPKDLPGFLRTVGKYVGALKKQASEFRQHLDDAIRDTELDQLRKDVSNLRSEVTDTVRSATRDIKKDVADAQSTIRDTVDEVRAPVRKPSDKAGGNDSAGDEMSRGASPTGHTEGSRASTGRSGNNTNRRRNIGTAMSEDAALEAGSAASSSKSTSTFGTAHVRTDSGAVEGVMPTNGAAGPTSADPAPTVQPATDPLAARPQPDGANAAEKTDA